MTPPPAPQGALRPTLLLRWLYRVLGLLALLLGLIGALLPVMPTTPFVLLAGFFFARGSPRLHRWLLDNRMMGPMIRDWQNHGVIRPRAKLMATALILPLCGYSLVFVALPLWVRLALPAICAGVLCFIWSRPSRPGAAAAQEAGRPSPNLLRKAAAESEL